NDDVPDASHSSNEFLVRITDLVTQMADVHVHNIHSTSETLIPHMIDNHVSRQNAIGIRHQVFQQAVFFSSKLDAFSTPAYLLRQPVQFKIGNTQDAFAPYGSAPQQSFDSDHQLCHCERFCEVIVRPCLEVSDFIHYRVSCR